MYLCMYVGVPTCVCKTLCIHIVSSLSKVTIYVRDFFYVHALAGNSVIEKSSGKFSLLLPA